MNTFCRHCEKEKEEKITLLRELFIYFICFFFAPFGMYWFFKYFRNTDGFKKRVAYMSLVITVIAVVVTTIVIVSYIQSIKGYMNTSQFKQFSDLGL